MKTDKETIEQYFDNMLNELKKMFETYQESFLSNTELELRIIAVELSIMSIKNRCKEEQNPDLRLNIIESAKALYSTFDADYKKDFNIPD